MSDDSEGKETCFIISPIGNRESDVRIRTDKLMKFIIKPVLNEFQIEPYNANDIPQSGDIPTQIVEHIIKSNMVIADLSDYNPNVFYELAIRHMTERPCIQMISERQIDKIPFDLNSIRTISYDDNFSAENVKEVKKILFNHIQYFKKKPLMENFVSETIRKISGEKFLQDLYPSGDKSVLSFLIDSNIDILDAIFDVSRDILQTQWYISHPNLFESRKNDFYAAPEHKLLRPSAYDSLQYRKRNYDLLKEQGASENELLKLKIEIYKDFLEWKKDVHNQKSVQISNGIHNYPNE
jgi:hypothetical protein